MGVKIVLVGRRQSLNFNQFDVERPPMDESLFLWDAGGTDYKAANKDCPFKNNRKGVSRDPRNNGWRSSKGRGRRHG